MFIKHGSRTSIIKTSEDDILNIKEVHDSWKQKGFPYYPTDTKWRNEIFNQLINFKRDTLIDRKNKIIGQ